MTRSFPTRLLIGLAWLNLASTVQAVTCQNNLPASNPDAVYTDHGDGTVTDTRTGLMWKTCVEGVSGATCAKGTPRDYSWAAALAQAEAATFAGHDDWRLPNLKELRSLVEECRTSPAINDQQFPNTPSSDVWSGSPYASGSDYAWSVYFGNGRANGYNRSVEHPVRLVRGGQSFDPLPRFNAMLLLHGMNSGPDAWKELIKDYWGEGNCVNLYNGKRELPGQPIQTKPDVGACYALRFGAHDTSRPGLEDAGLSGDFSTTAELGQEVQAALTLIRAERPKAQARVALLAHSRGGLAARAFLQQASCTAEEKAVQSLTTVVTPHQGSRFGRAYQWLADHPRPANCKEPTGKDIAICQDWKTVDFLRGVGTCNLIHNPGPLDVRRPVIDYLSDQGAEIKTLNAARGNLLQSCGQDPIKLRWLTSMKVDLGYLGRIVSKGLYTVLDRPWSGDWCEQLSDPAANYLVSGEPWSTDKVYQFKLEKLAGDGIIDTASQSPADWQGQVIGTTAAVWTNREVLHTEAPAKTADISLQLKLVPVPWWKPSAQARQKSAIELAVGDAPAAVAPTPAETQARWARWSSAIQQAEDGRAADTLPDDGLSLRQALTARADPAVLQDMARRLAADSTPLAETGAMADVLALTARSETATLLVDALSATDAPERQAVYRRALERLAAEVTVDQRAGVTEALLTGWREARREPDLTSLALALGTASDPEGVAALIEPLQTRARRGPGAASGADATHAKAAAIRTNAAALGLSKVWREEAAGVLIQAFETAVAERWPSEMRNPIARALSKTGSAEAVPVVLGALPSVASADQAEVQVWVRGLAARRWSRLALEDWLTQAARQPAWVIRMVAEAVAR